MKFLKAIYYIFLACIGAIAILLVISVFPITGNIKFMIVQSGSMAPDIKMGSIVVAKPMAEYKIGDVITFGQVSRTKTPTTHRIHDIEISEGIALYITKGDANNAPDQRKVRGSEIIGKVLFDVPYLGYVVDFAQKPLGFVLVIIVPAAIIVYDEIRKIFKEAKKIKNKKKQAKTEA